MPIQAPQWTDYLNCPVCCRKFGAQPRSPISLGCGHTLCRHCLKHLNRKQCPFDQTDIQVEPEEFVVNTALLQLAGYTPPVQPYHPPTIQALPEQERQAYDIIVRCMEHLSICLKYHGNVTNNNAASRLSRPMQRKLVTLLQCSITDEDGRGRTARAVRSLAERTVTEFILQHQNPQQLSANLWAAVRARGCQFLGPAMQEEVLKLVLLTLEDGSALSRKVLVMFVVQRLEPHFPQASKTSIGHVVQLLYRASCFKVSKRESDSSLMQLKEEFRTYNSLRREHDTQIVQIATEAGLRIAPDQWSALLYGDTQHKSHMQSIIDKLQTPQTFVQSVQELFITLQRTGGDPEQLILLTIHLERLTNIDPSPDAKSPTWPELAEIMTSLKVVITSLTQYLEQAICDTNQNPKHLERPESATTQEVINQILHAVKTANNQQTQARQDDTTTTTPSPRGGMPATEARQDDTTTTTPSPRGGMPATAAHGRVRGGGMPPRGPRRGGGRGRGRGRGNNGACQRSLQNPSSPPTHHKYKVSMCRDAATRSYCPRGATCTFAHSEEELEKYRSLRTSNGNFTLLSPVPQAVPLPSPQAIQLPRILAWYPRSQPLHVNNYNLQPITSMPPSHPNMLTKTEHVDNHLVHVHNVDALPQHFVYNRTQAAFNHGDIIIPLPERLYYSRFGTMHPIPEEQGNMQYPTEFQGLVYQGFVQGPPTMSQNPEEISEPLPNMLLPVQHELRRNVSPYPIDDQPSKLQPDYRVKSHDASAASFASVPRDISPDPTWHPANEAFNFDGIRTALPESSCDAEDQELEEELQALERRIDTEFKSAD